VPVEAAAGDHWACPIPLFRVFLFRPIFLTREIPLFRKLTSTTYFDEKSLCSGKPIALQDNSILRFVAMAIRCACMTS
jgi:hypothetical protein